MTPKREKPVRLATSLREKIWGKRQLAPWFPDSDVPIGEAWYLADRDLPLLVKLIFTSERLSIQAHPDDGEDGPRGKTEMWHILEAEPGATIAMGFREPITRERLWDAVRTGEIENLVNWIPVHPGETYFMPAHTVHAIGGGIVLCEIQQNSDVTYRLWDYGRPREIHVNQAVPIADLTVHPGAVQDGRVECKHFITETGRLDAGASAVLPRQSSHLFICVEGRGTIGDEPYRLGEVWLLPEKITITADANTRFLRTWTP